MLPLPNKFHGLTDKEIRFRQRYVDLMVNPEVKRNFVIRSQFIKYMRKYLDDMNYIEVETPVLNTIAGGASARPFTPKPELSIWNTWAEGVEKKVKVPSPVTVLASAPATAWITACWVGPRESAPEEYQSIRQCFWM